MPGGKFTDSRITENLKVATEYFKATVANKSNKNSGGSIGFIPFKMNFTMDGLSGIKIYNELNVDTSFLPQGYSKTLKFIVTGVDHKLSKNDWETTIHTTLIPTTSNVSKITGSFKVSLKEEVTPEIPEIETPTGTPDQTPSTILSPTVTPERDAWILLAIVLREGGGDKQSVVDVAQSIANRAGSKSYGGVTNGSIYSLVTSFNQYQPAFKDGNGNVSNEWLNVKDFTTAKIAANYKYEESDKRKFQDSVKGNKYNTFDEWIGAQLKAIWLNLIDQNLRANAASFIQGRTDFKSTERFGGSRAGASTIISNANNKAKLKKSNNNVWRGTSDHNVFGWQYYYQTNTTYSLPSIADLMKLKSIFDNVIIKR